MTGITDLHHHILWGLDDGPETEQEMHKMLRRASGQGVRTLFATPHACPGFVPFDRELYRQRLKEAQAFSDAEGLGLTLLEGAEIAWTYCAADALANGRVPSLNGTEYALIELWHDITWPQVREITQKLLRAGFTPVFAHVERYRCFLWQPQKAVRFKSEFGVCYQMNASFVLSPGGLVQRRFLKKMLKAQAIDAVASDAHDVKNRRIRLNEAEPLLKERCGEAYAKKLLTFDGVLS